MTVVSPDTPQRTRSTGTASPQRSRQNIPTNYNNCPNDGTPPPCQRRCLRRECHDASGAGRNPFDGYVDNSVTNLALDDPGPATA